MVFGSRWPYDPVKYPFRTTWSHHDGQWSKLEDRVPWAKAADKDISQDGKPLDRLVTSFSPDAEAGRRPSIQSSPDTLRGPGIKRTAQDSDLPERVEPPTMDDAGAPLQPEVPAQADALAVYCRECGCGDQHRDLLFAQCSRCSATSFVSDPREVKSWFDEVEERAALEQLPDLTYDKRIKHWSDHLRANVNELALPAPETLDDAYDHEAFLLDIGQCFQHLPEDARQDTSTAWSVATKDEAEPDDEWQWQSIFDDIHVAQDTLMDEMQNKMPARLKTLFVKHQMKNKTKRMGKRRVPLQRRERHWLRRHGRDNTHVVGWDGSPPELQPYFQQDDFSKIYYNYVIDVSKQRTATTDPEVEADAKCFQDQGQPTWEQANWHAKKEKDTFSTFFVEETQTITGPESSDEEGDEAEDSGRAMRQALKKEVPWRTIDAADWPKFVQSNKDEWAEWQKWSSCQAVYPKPGEIDPKLILKSRICYRWKPKDGGKWFKPKSRIVVQGYLDPHLPLLSRDAPVLAKGSLVLIIQWASGFNVKLWNGDCKSAFLQGEPDTERPVQIYMKPPQDPVALDSVAEWSHPLLLYALTAPVYGQANAPRRWFLHVLNTMSWEQHSLDPCCFLQLDGEGEDRRVVAVLGIHVDDVICCCLPGYEALLDKVKASFEWGSEWECDDFVFTGRRIKRQSDGSFHIDQEHYVADISKTKITMDDSEKLSDHPELVTEFRSGIGSLQWMAGTTRGDLAADVSLLQRPPKELTVADLKEVNKVLKYVKATSNAYFRINPIQVEDMTFIAYGDSGWANAPNNKSQGGLVVLASDKRCLEEPRPASLLEWKSYRHQRVLRSSNFLACTFSEMVYGNYKATCAVPRFPVIPVTDARSLWDAIHRLSTTFSEKRVEIDVASLRQNCRSLRWVPTEEQKADALTKRSNSLRDSFRKWAMQPVVALTDAKTAEEGEDNAKWKAQVSANKKVSQCYSANMYHGQHALAWHLDTPPSVDI